MSTLVHTDTGPTVDTVDSAAQRREPRQCRKTEPQLRQSHVACNMRVRNSPPEREGMHIISHDHVVAPQSPPAALCRLGSRTRRARRGLLSVETGQLWAIYGYCEPEGQGLEPDCWVKGVPKGVLEAGRMGPGGRKGGRFVAYLPHVYRSCNVRKRSGWHTRV